MTEERLRWVALALCPGIGPKMFRTLLSRFGSASAVFHAEPEELAQVPRLTSRILNELQAISIPALEEELASLSDEAIEIVTLADEHYPANLRALPEAPPVLFVRGEILPQDEQAVAIVGSREASRKAETCAENLAAGFAQKGWTVVSGLALGIDTVAHAATLDARGRTIGVLGSGLRVIHPKSNQRLAEDMARSGAVVSECAPKSPPLGRNLMARDRIISGLARAVIVVEAGEKSGSLDTAKKARKQGRPVFAVDTGSAGTDQLLATGAIAIHPSDFDLDEIIRLMQPPASPKSGEQMGLFGT